MTLQNMIEMIQEQFPKKPATLITIELNKAQREFCEQTGVLLTDYPVDIDTTKATYEIPPNVSKLKSVSFLDVNDQFLSKLPITVKLEDRLLTLYNKATGQPLTSYPSTVAKMLWRVVYLPDDLANATDRPLMEASFHDALLAKVFQKFFAFAGNPQMAMYYKAEWKDYLKQGRIYANQQADGGPWRTEYEIL